MGQITEKEVVQGDVLETQLIRKMENGRIWLRERRQLQLW